MNGVDIIQIESMQGGKKVLLWAHLMLIAVEQDISIGMANGFLLLRLLLIRDMGLIAVVWSLMWLIK